MIITSLLSIFCFVNVVNPADFFSAKVRKLCPAHPENEPVASRLECAIVCQRHVSCCGFYFNETSGHCFLSHNNTATSPRRITGNLCTFYMRHCITKCPTIFNETLPSASGRRFYYGTEVSTVATVRDDCADKGGYPIEYYPIQVFNESKPGIVKMLRNIDAVEKVSHACKYYNEDKRYCHLPFSPIFLTDGTMLWPNINVVVTNSDYTTYNRLNTFWYERTTSTNNSAYISFDNTTLETESYVVTQYDNQNDSVMLICECKQTIP